MKYQKTVNIWALSDEECRKLQPGQWVRAGSSGSVGRFWGVRSTGSKVVAWQENARNAQDYSTYQKFLCSYARG